MTQAEPTQQAQGPVHTRALIIGTGFSGLGMGIRLQQQGVDFVILEKADDVGGTWRDNSYPGCACDIPSHLYSFSFEPKPDWKNPFSYQPEIWDYLKGVTEKYGLRRYIEFNSLVDRAYWDDDECRWHVFTSDGREYVRTNCDTARSGRPERTFDQNVPGCARACRTNVRSIAGVTRPRGTATGAAVVSSKCMNTGSLVYCAMPAPYMNGRNARSRSRGRQPKSVVSSVATIASQPQSSARRTKLRTTSSEVLQ